MALLKMAVLGLSHGLKFVNCLKKCGEAKLVAVADLDPDKAISLSGAMNTSLADCLGNDVAIYKDYRDLLEDMHGNIDGVFAALPNQLHVEVTEEVAKRGLALLLEKPIACTMAEASRIIDIVDKLKIKFMVGHHRRFNKKVIRVKEAIEKGELGKILGANMVWAAKKADEYFEQEWRITENIGGPLLNNLIHDIDNLRYMIGEIEMVHARVSNLSRGNPVEDTCAVLAGFKNGAVASIFLADNAPSPWFYEACTQENDLTYPCSSNCYTFFGEKASLSFPNMDLFYYEPGTKAGWQWPIKQERLVVDRFNVIDEEVKHFCALISGEEESKITARDAAESLRVIEAIKESSKLGKAVYLF